MSLDHCDLLLIDTLNRAPQRSLWVADDNTQPAVLQQVRANPNIEVITNRYDLAQQFKSAGFTTFLSDFEFDQLSDQYQWVAFPVCKERSLAHHCINSAFEKLTINGQLILIGEKNQGIKTHCKNAEKVFRNNVGVKKQGTAYKGTAIKTSVDSGECLNDQNYAAVREISVDGWSFYSKPGVYGWEKVDRGSAFLIDECKKFLQRCQQCPNSLLDLGCGYGYLTLMTQELNIPLRAATDNNCAAIKAALENFRRAGLDVQCTLDDCGSNIQQQFDLILCNPPFHRGFKTSGALTQKFLTSTHRLLHPKGTALWVLNAFLDAEQEAAKYFQHIEVLAANNQFKILKLAKPTA